MDEKKFIESKSSRRVSSIGKNRNGKLGRKAECAKTANGERDDVSFHLDNGEKSERKGSLLLFICASL